ncbi:unnamed protein product [Cylindrotheca closterium]|uniref:Protochlorophyllide reductase n=1 Tax=Cylindrotheca closterium TaxID=2856 RepID=A0AAD2G7B0_9STRA|nr:unnamed protein product [Cylindrotheca closterium]
MPEGGNWKDLFKAAEEGDLAKTRYHLAGGVDPNWQHPEYFTAPIHEAIKNGNLEIVKVLVEEGGANPGLMEELTDDTTIEIARASLQFEILDYLNSKVPAEARFDSRVVLVTEGLMGTGKPLALELLLKGHQVFFVASSEEEATKASEELRLESGNSKLGYIIGKLSTIADVYKLAENVQQQIPKLNTLIHNACIWPFSRQTNDDDLESSFMVNYMARYILTKTLKKMLEGNKAPRIIYVNPETTWREPDLIDTPIGVNFSWYKSMSETVACSTISFLNCLQDMKGSGVTVMLAQVGKPHNSIEKESSGCYWPLVEIAQAVFPDARNVTDTIAWMVEGGQGKNFHGKIYNGDKEEVTNYTVMSIPKEWEQWTTDFLSRSS